MKKIILSLALLSIVLCGASAQTEMLPVDENVRVGHLDNGLTYYIRHNELPKERCEFHIAQAVGATLEEDNQNGLAHFLEHMCFNGTEHFPGKLIINYFESVGVTFGGNINAYTSLDKTVYRLSEVPTYREGIIDSALLVMHDWSCAVSLLGEEIDAERGVIREEWRTGNNANRRIWKQQNAQLYPGTRYATRDVIGDTAVINNFTYEALRSYYKKWYGPDLQAIIVVGDIDVDQMEQKIKDLWKDVPARENRGERPFVTIPDNKEPIVSIVRDAEGQYSRLGVIYKHAPIEERFKGTNVAYITDIINNLVSSMLGERLQEITLSPKSPILGGYMGYTDIFPTLDGFYTQVVAKEGQEKEAYALLLEQIEKMRRYGFTEDELDRAKTEMLNSYEKSFNERTATRNVVFVQEYIRNFLDGEAIPGIEFELNLLKAVLPMFNAEQINHIIQNYVTDENILIAMSAPLKDEVKLPTKEEAVAAIAAMKDLEIEAPVAEEVDKVLVKKEPKSGKVKKTAQVKGLEATEWTLKNGVRVVIKPTAFKQDEIRMSAFSFGGYSLIKTEDLPTAELTTDIIDMMGYGDFSTTALQKALAGKTVSCYASINENTESLGGSSSIKDFETLLQLIYLGFTAPRVDEEAYASFISQMESQLKNIAANPKSAFSDSIQMMSSNYSERTVLWKQETLDQVSMDKALAIYKERFANPADFTFIFVGNIDPTNKATRQLIEKWLGGLKTAKSREKFADQHIRAPKGINKNYFTRDMKTKTGSNRIQYTAYGIPYTLANDLNMRIIGQILSTRYLESIREREGGSYGVGTGAYLKAYPVPEAILIMQFDTDPDKQARLMDIIHEEVMTIYNDGPLLTDLQKEKEAMLKAYKENLEKNNWWVNTIDCYYKLGVNYATEYEEAVNAITAESVKAMIRRLVDAGNMFEVVMLPQD